MPRFPTYQAGQGLNTDRGGKPHVVPGANIGRAIQGVGASISAEAEKAQKEEDAFRNFKTASAFERFKIGNTEALVANADNAAPGAPNLTATSLVAYDKASAEYLKTVDDDLKPRYKEMVQTNRARYALRASSAQHGLRQDYFKTELHSSEDVARINVSRNPANLRTILNAEKKKIDLSGLSPVTKTARKKAIAALLTADHALSRIKTEPEFRARVQKGGRAQTHNQITVASVLASKGWTPVQIAGVIGNLTAESNLKTSAVGDGGTSIGIAQWHKERATALKQFAKSLGKDWRDIETQALFIDHELRNSEKSAGDALSRAKTVEEATKAFVGFERPRGFTKNNPAGSLGFKRRLSAANKFAGDEDPEIKKIIDVVGFTAGQKLVRAANKATASEKFKFDVDFANDKASLKKHGVGVGAINDSNYHMLTNKKVAELDFAKFEHDITQRITDAKPDELLDILKSLKPEGEGFADEQKRFDFAEKAIQDRIKEQKEDGAGYVLRTNDTLSGLYDDAIASKDAGQIEAAIAAIREAQRTSGVAPVDIKSLPKKALSELTAEIIKPSKVGEKVTGIDIFDNITGIKQRYGRQAENVFKEIAANGGGKGFGEISKLIDAGYEDLAKSLANVVSVGAFGSDALVAMKLIDARSLVAARDIFDGRFKRTLEKNLVPKGKDDKGNNFDQVITATIGDALKESPSVYAAMREAVISIYANTSQPGEAFETDKVKAAVLSATGGILQHNGSGDEGKFLAPIVGMTDNQFMQALIHVTNEDMKGAFDGNQANRKQVTADMLRDDLQFISSGDGKYNLKLPGQGVGLVANFDGKEFVFDLKKLLPTLIKRAVEAEAKAVGNNPIVDSALFPQGKLEIIDPATGEVTDSISTTPTTTLAEKPTPTLRPFAEDEKGRDLRDNTFGGGKFGGEKHGGNKYGGLRFGKSQ